MIAPFSEKFCAYTAALMFSSTILLSCVTSSPKITKHSKHGKLVSVRDAVANSDETEVLPDADIGQCKDPASNVSKPTPFYIPSLDVFMTDFTNHCKDSYLVEKDSDWAAMRVPCTEGNGVVEEKGGSSANPNLVGFAIDLNCEFIPKDQAEFEAKINKSLGLVSTAASLAINPLSVQYWEVENSNDADVGNVVLLRTNGGLEKYKVWERGPKGKSIKVELYGRESAWGSEQHFYHYSTEIVWTGYHRFRIKVLSAKVLSEEEKEELGSRCRSLQPKRNCQLVF